ncbi:shikimate kinase [Acidipropionibacterium timonense]|uniref:shikimate kinase n=1 Tax=Acidipropionibacterium timonense TaxID=2161818 RepID=UPI0010304067|nr:shikimate kinase [Acidipropionibacterium timonense]
MTAASRRDPQAVGAPRVIAVIGAPGSGKSTTGALLAERLGVSFVDVDAVIEGAEGRSISDIFIDEGESYFRTLERAATLRALAGEGVVSLGGGAPLEEEIGRALDQVCTVWLDVSARTASGRVGLNDATRPMLLGNVHSRMVKLMAARRPAYERPAKVTVATDTLSPHEVVDAIVDALADLAGEPCADGEPREAR